MSHILVVTATGINCIATIVTLLINFIYNCCTNTLLLCVNYLILLKLLASKELNIVIVINCYCLIK